jgi:PAS domain S-box-containing protein
VTPFLVGAIHSSTGTICGLSPSLGFRRSRGTYRSVPLRVSFFYLVSSSGGLIECVLLTATLVVALGTLRNRQSAPVGLALGTASLCLLASNPVLLGTPDAAVPLLSVLTAALLLIATALAAIGAANNRQREAQTGQGSQDGHYASNGQGPEGLAASHKSLRGREKAENRLQQLFDATPDPYILYDAELAIVDANPAALGMIGQDLDNIRGHRLEELGVLSAEDLERLPGRRSDLSEGRNTAPTRFEITHTDGTKRVAEFRGYPINVDGEAFIVGLGHDATEKIAAEDQRRQIETRFRLLAERCPALLWTTDRQLRFTSVAGSALERFSIPQFATSQPTITEVCARLEIEGSPLAAHQDALAGTAVNFEVAAQGVSFHAYVEPLSDKNGEICGAIGVAVDVTGQMLAEAQLRTLNGELEDRVAHRTQQLQRAMEELADFSYAVSHDLRAPLRTLAGFSEALAEDAATRLNSDDQHWLTRIRRAAKRMDTMIDAMLKLARLSRTEPHRQSLDLTQIANEIAAKLERQEPCRQVEWIIDDQISAYGDEALVRVLVENLLSNAWKFTAEVDNPKIEFFVVPDQVEVASYCVRDNGLGFDASVGNKAFRPFQGVDDDDEFNGTGLGLATISRIIARHGGTIDVKSKPGRGAAFTFSLGFSAAALRAKHADEAHSIRLQ